ncbi:MAG: hypothetical protein QM747_03495 [Nocardioides sp.]
MTLGMTEAPPARRASTPGWRDPRLWIGLAIVAASVVAGGLVLGSSDGSVPVWVATSSLGAGQALTSDDLGVRRVRFVDAGDAALYFRADEQLPAGLHLRRDVGAGELVPRAAVTDSATPDVRAVPVSVAPDQVPAGVSTGDRVDVYVRPGDTRTCADSSACDGSPALSGVRVIDAPPVDDRFGTDGSRMLVLAMTAGQAQRFFATVETTDAATLTVVGREASR